MTLPLRMRSTLEKSIVLPGWRSGIDNMSMLLRMRCERSAGINMATLTGIGPNISAQIPSHGQCSTTPRRPSPVTAHRQEKNALVSMKAHSKTGKSPLGPHPMAGAAPGILETMASVTTLVV